MIGSDRPPDDPEPCGACFTRSLSKHRSGSFDTPFRQARWRLRMDGCGSAHPPPTASALPFPTRPHAVMTDSEALAATLFPIAGTLPRKLCASVTFVTFARSTPEPAHVPSRSADRDHPPSPTVASSPTKPRSAAKPLRRRSFSSPALTQQIACECDFRDLWPIDTRTPRMPAPCRPIAITHSRRW